MSGQARLLGQFSVPQAAGVRRLASTIRAQTATSQTSPPPQGVVTAVNATTPPTCTVSFDDGDSPNLRYLKSYTPTVGDVVEVSWRNGDPYILGALA